MKRLQTEKAKHGGRVETMTVAHFPPLGTRQRYTISDVFEHKLRNRWRGGEETFRVCLAFRETTLVLPLEEERLQAALEASDDDPIALVGRTCEVWLEEKLSKDGKTPLGGRHPHKRVIDFVSRDPGDDDDSDDGAQPGTAADSDEDIPF